MKNHLIMAALSATITISCGGDSGSSGNKASKKEYVNINSINSEFNLKKTVSEYSLDGIKRAHLDLFSFDRDVRLNYLKELPDDKIRITTYIVSKNARFSLSGNPSERVNSEQGALYLRSNSSRYSCSISVGNGGVIKSLEGSCYIRVLITLPLQKKLEVYNNNRLLTRLMFAMSNIELLERIDSEPFTEAKLLIIDQYIRSHKVIGSSPRLEAIDVLSILAEFTFQDDKYEALSRVHALVDERETLREVIESSFSYFAREKAYKNCGTNKLVIRTVSAALNTNILKVLASFLWTNEVYFRITGEL